MGDFLATSGHQILYVLDRNPLMDDDEILRWAVEDGCILVTNDKDFGRCVFLQGAPHAGNPRLPNAIPHVLVELTRQVLARHETDLAEGAIVTASTRSIRVRRQSPS